MRRAALAFVVGLGLLVSGSTSLAANRVTFQDATGEDPALDITTVVVSDRDEGTITFRINIPGRPTLSDDMRFRIWLDSDDNLRTGLTPTGGSPTGFDHFLLWDRDGLRLARCQGSACAASRVSATSLSFSYASGPTLTVHAAELGETRRFRFAVEASVGIVPAPGGGFDFTNFHSDAAPAKQGEVWTELWSYAIRFAPSRLLVKDFSTAPAVARAGSPFTVRLAASTETGTTVADGRVTCTATVAGRRVNVRARGFMGRRAFCTFAIPASARAQTIRGSITVVSGASKVTRTFRRTIV